MTSVGRHAVGEAVRVAQVGYTAVIDRMTPALDHSVVAANVARSVTSAGGAPVDPAPAAAAWAPARQRGAVTLFDERHAAGEFGVDGTFAFAISVEVQGVGGSLASTAVLHEPSERLRSDAAAVSAALHAVIGAMHPGVPFAAMDDLFAAGTAAVSAPVRLVVLTHDGRAPDGAETTPAAGDVVALGAITRTAEGPIAFQTTVGVGTDGAERLDAFPLRLIELR